MGKTLINICNKTVDAIPEIWKYSIRGTSPTASTGFNKKWSEPSPSYQHANKSKNTLNKAKEKAAEQANKVFLKEKKSLGNIIDGIA